MNNPFEESEDEKSFNFAVLDTFESLPNFSTSDNQLREIGTKLGGYRVSTNTILNNIAHFDEIQATCANARDAAEEIGDYDQAQFYQDQRLEAKRHIKKWKKRLIARRKEQISGVTQINIRRS